MALAGAPKPKQRRPQRSVSIADANPVARVLLDVPLPHLDRPFDYTVPADMAVDAVPGARVKVRFAGTDHAGFIVERASTTDHDGPLTPLRRVVSAEPVLTSEVAGLARAVADRYSGTVADVLRLAIPPRHARVEARESVDPPPTPNALEPGGWSAYAEGKSLLDALGRGGSPRAVVTVGPGADWPDLVARLMVATLSAGRGAVMVLPDGRDVARLDDALVAILGKDHHVVLGADLGPEARYRRWLAVRRGSVRAVIGPRSAAFAPVANLGLVGIWDDGDDVHAELRAPYPHMREVVLLRAHLSGSAAIVGGLSRTAEAQQLVRSGWSRSVELPRADVRSAAPRVRVSGDDWEQARDDAARVARLPSLAWRVAREGLMRGPVLIQVPRTGYVPAVACSRCRTAAHCARCGGPMNVGKRGAVPSCAWCGVVASEWSCSACGNNGLRAVTIGVRRTAEELGRAFSGVPVVVSRGDDVRDSVSGDAALVLATPGAEPVADGGYAAGLLLDGAVLLARPELRAAEEALRRWLRACALVRAETAGGEVVLVADSSAPAAQALVRWDPTGFADRELVERAALRFPPIARVAECAGAERDVEELLSLVELPSGADVLGPMPGPDGDSVRVIVRVPRTVGSALARSLKAAAGVRSVKKSGGSVRIRVDPVDLA